MAKIVITDGYTSINGVNFSPWVRKITLAATAAELASQTMGDTWEEVEIGLKKFVGNLELEQGYAAAEADDSLWTMFDGAAAAGYPLIVRPSSAAVGSSNPQWTGQIKISTYTPLDVSHGELSVITQPLVGHGALARATS